LHFAEHFFQLFDVQIPDDQKRQNQFIRVAAEKGKTFSHDSEEVEVKVLLPGRIEYFIEKREIHIKRNIVDKH
jgi:hypothetical protein